MKTILHKILLLSTISLVFISCGSEEVKTEKRGETLYEEWLVEGKEKMVLCFEGNTLIAVERR